MSTPRTDLSFATITNEDIPALTTLMTAAFDRDAQLHLGKQKGGPEGYDNGDFFRKWLFGQDATAGFKVLANGDPVGAAIVWVFPNGHNRLGVLFVDPERQDEGIGSQIWEFIEASYPFALSWQLTTPALSIKNRYFYSAKCSFAEDGITDGFVHMTKQMRQRAGA